MKNRTLFPITTMHLKAGIAKLNLMLINAQTKTDMYNILPYCNIILQHLATRRDNKLGDIIFNNYWNTFEEIRDAKN